MTAPVPTGQPDLVRAVADALDVHMPWMADEDDVREAARVAVAAYEREVLSRRPDAERLTTLAQRGEVKAKVRPVAEGYPPELVSPPVDPRVYARDVEYLLAALAAETAAREATEARLAGLKHRFGLESYGIEQTLGKALGYPAYGPEMFEDGQPNEDVCVGEHVPASLAAEAARRIGELTAAREQATRLLADALHLRQHGERSPGAPADPAAETWADWDRRAEEHLRAGLDGS